MSDQQPTDNKMQQVIETQVEMMLQRIYPELTEEEKTQLQSASVTFIQGGMPPADEHVQAVFNVLRTVSERLQLGYASAQTRVENWFEYLGFAISALVLAGEGGLDIRDVFASAEDDGEMTLEDQTMIHMANYFQTKLLPVIPTGDMKIVRDICSVVMSIWQEPELIEAGNDALNRHLQPVVPDDTERKRVVEKINDVLDGAEVEEAVFATVIARSHLVKYEQALPEPNSDSKQALRQEMHQLMKERLEMLKNINPSLKDQFDANTDRLTELSEEVFVTGTSQNSIQAALVEMGLTAKH